MSQKNNFTLDFTQLREMLSEFSGNVDRLSRTELLKRLNEIKKPVLASKLTEWRKSDKGNKNILYRRIAEHLNVQRQEAQDEDEMDTTPADGDINCLGQEDGPSAKRENRCWNKGNWLSFLVNIAGQIEY